MDIYGVIGWPIKHTLSPFMHNAAFKKLGIDATYLAFEIKSEDLEDFILNRKDVVGFNVTIPHKVRTKEILERNPSRCLLHPEENALQNVRLSSAVNTIKRYGDKLLYFNTDVVGFARSLNEEKIKSKGKGFETRDKNIFLIGCGGAGRAVITSLIWRWENPYIHKIYVYDVNMEVLEAAKKHFLQFTALQGRIEFVYNIGDISNIIKKCKLLVNASPVGMNDGDDTSIIRKGLFHSELSVYDLVYNRETQLIKDAKSLGLYWASGKGMLLYQAVETLELWLDIKKLSDDIIAVMRLALDKALHI